MTPQAGGNPIQLLMELRRAGIDDTGVLSAIERLPRDAFAAVADRPRAWSDVALPGLSRPLHAATYLRALALEGRERVLLVPMGSGYLPALIAGACRMVYTQDSDRTVRAAAEARLKALKINNVVSRMSDPLAGWTQQAPFDRIVVDELVPTIPTPLLAQLRDGGCLLLPIGEERVAPEVRSPRFDNAHITRITRRGDDYESESILRTQFGR